MSETKSHTKLILLGITVAMVALIILLGILRPPKKDVQEGQEAPIPVTTLTVQLTDTADVVILPALIAANVDAVLSAEKAGRIIELKTDRGDRVEKGQLLMQIDDRIWQANLKQAKIAAQDATKNYERFKKLQESGAVADSEYDSIEAAYIRAEAMATEAEINIEQCRITSPITGIINDRFVETGEFVSPGTPAFQVVDKATVKVVILIPERDVFSINKGDSVNFTIQPLPKRTFEGKVTFVASQADGRNNAFRTEITVDNSDGILRPGMIAQVEFSRGINKNMVSLPMSAVLPSKGDHIVYLAKDGQAVRRKVEIETITRERALISDGLEPGDRVILEGNRTLNDGQLVKLLDQNK